MDLLQWRPLRIRLKGSYASTLHVKSSIVACASRQSLHARRERGGPS